MVIVPAWVPGATVGAAAGAAADGRPENACCSNGASFSARWFCRLKTKKRSPDASPPLRSRRSIHFFASSRYAGCGVITSSALSRSIGMMRRMPVSGLRLRSPMILSSSWPTVFTSALCSVKSPTDIPAIQSTSKVSMVSSRCFSSRSVPERTSRLRRSSGRIAVASLTKGSRMRAISRTPM
ncbi:MAG: hypothetical protein IPH55_03225 [Betaproteobacteria bacterium]|nr:hypothetical protein [Betaproteobacteria bacterium]